MAWFADVKEAQAFTMVLRIGFFRTGTPIFGMRQGSPKRVCWKVERWKDLQWLFSHFNLHATADMMREAL